MLGTVGFAQPASAAATPAGRDVYSGRTGAAHSVKLPARSKTPPVLSAAEAAQVATATARMNRHRGGPPPVAAQGSASPRTAQSGPGSQLAAPTTFSPRVGSVPFPGPNDLYGFRQSSLTNVTPNPTPYGSTNPSQIAEPSVSNNGNEVFYTGNWFAAVSSDSGASWGYTNPYTAFTPPPSEAFCCDQSTLYDPTRNLTIWDLLYIYPNQSAGDNVLRLAVASGQSGVTSGAWNTFDFQPSAQFLAGNQPIFSPGSWIDYPQLGLSPSSLFVSVNIFLGGGSDPGCANPATTCLQQGSVMMRIPLDALAGTAPFSFAFYASHCTASSCDDTFTPVSKSGATMYWGAHGGTGTVADPTNLRVFSWTDGQAAPSITNVADQGFNYMYGMDGICQVGGINPCLRDDSRLKAGWVGPNSLGFAWDAKQDGAHPYPYIRMVQIDTGSRTVSGDSSIAYTKTAAVYPFVAANARGALGLSMVVAGGQYFPSTQVGVQDDLSPPGSWNFWWIAQGSANPAKNEWGDYLAVRPASGLGNTWIATGYSIQGGLSEPVFSWFGRERDDPFVAQNMFCSAAGMTSTIGAQTPNQLIATFTATTGRLSDYTWKIDWGDGTTSSGAVSGTGSSGTVSASHAFASAGTPRVTVSVLDPTLTPATCSFLATVSGSVYTTSSTLQYTLPNGNGTTWKDLDNTRLILNVTAAGPSRALISGNVDLWTSTTGVNQDIGIAVDGKVVAWKESGGYAGTFSPNAAFVQTDVKMTAGTHTVTLVWKTNTSTTGTIFAGAGPIGFEYSPTRITAQVIPDPSPTFMSQTITTQPTLVNNDGIHWQPLSSALKFTFPTSTAGSLLIGGNADLWTVNAGINQDIGIRVDGTVVAWKESGGFAGTYSPNAAFVQAVVPVPATTGSHVIELVWKANKNVSGTIAAGAGPIGTAYSPTSLTAQFIPTAGIADASSNQQYTNPNSSGVDWHDIDTQQLSLSLPANAAANCVAIVGGNADLWTASAGYNQDIAITVNGIIDAWKESGGFAGTQSPNAAYVQTVIPIPSGNAPSMTLQWKTNIPTTPDVTIYAGAGPLSGQFSPTRLTAQIVCS